MVITTEPLPRSQLAVSERQAADLLGLSLDTMRRYRRQGTGPTFCRIGGPLGTIRYRVADLDQWLQGQRYESRGQEVARRG